MASRVDLPQPDGPAIDRYSPFLTSKWMDERACVSTSSVTKTLLTLSSRISGCAAVSMLLIPLYANRVSYVQKNFSVQFDTVILIVLRHVRQNYLVPHPQAVFDLDGVHRAAAEGDLHLVGVLAVGLQLEQRNGAVLLPEHGPAYEHHVVELFQLDGAVHAQIGPGAGRKRPLERHVHGDGAVHDGLLDARNEAVNQTGRSASRQPGIDDRGLSGSDVLDLGFGDLQLGF